MGRSQGTMYPFSFFDPEGYRFHLPAYLVDAVEKSVKGNMERAEEIIEFLLCRRQTVPDTRRYQERQETLLNRQQCEAVAACFTFFLEMGACAMHDFCWHSFSMDDFVLHHSWA